MLFAEGSGLDSDWIWICGTSWAEVSACTEGDDSAGLDTEAWTNAGGLNLLI